MAGNRDRKSNIRCSYQSSCYIASELNCFGYKIDCILYRKSNGEDLDDSRFDRAMDELINKTREKHISKVSK